MTLHRLCAFSIRLISTVMLCFTVNACKESSQKPRLAPMTLAEESTPTPADPALTEALQHFHQAKTLALTSTIECIDKITPLLDSLFIADTSLSLGKKALATRKKPLATIQQALQQCLTLYQPVHSIETQSNNPEVAALTNALYSAPILPGYVDYLVQYPNSGIVNDITLPITKISLRNQQGLTDSGEISLGFEVIAFLLFGEQRYNSSLAARPITDFTSSFTSPPKQEADSANVNRRQQYLTTVLLLLQEDLISLKDLLANQPSATQEAALNQAQAIQSTNDILQTMLTNIQQNNHDELSRGYWQLLKYTQDNTATNTLSVYLKWPQESPDLSPQAFAAQLQASLQRLNITTQ